MIFLVILAILIMLVLCISLWAFNKSCKPIPQVDDNVKLFGSGRQYTDKAVKMTQEMIKRPFTEVGTVSFDGLKLFGRFYKAESADAPLCICFHGYNGTARRDFAGGGAFLIDSGFNVLLVDQRAQGQSEGKYMSYGVLESRDVLSWIDFAKKTSGGYDRKIILMGISMGAATVLMASGKKLPSEVCGIIADCPFADAESVIAFFAKKNMHIPGAVCKFINIGAKLYGHFSITADSPAEAVQKSTVPILILHGDDDGLVPVEMSAVIADANPKMIRREIFPGAEHGMSFMSDPERYKSLVRGFINEVTEN